MSRQDPRALRRHRQIAVQAQYRLLPLRQEDTNLQCTTRVNVHVLQGRLAIRIPTYCKRGFQPLNFVLVCIGQSDGYGFKPLADVGVTVYVHASKQVSQQRAR